VNEDHRQTPIAADAISEEEDKHSSESWVCRIRVQGHLDGSWSEWFEGLVLTHEEAGTTVLTGTVIDQPALHGLLVRMRDLGLPLVSVSCAKPREGEVPNELI
jgi:hypothetical protein